LQHASEGSTRFSIRVDILLLIIQVGIVDTGCSRDKKLEVSSGLSFFH
jgi:hypothetical protein